MIEPTGRGPKPSREGGLVWILVVTATIAVLVSLALPLAQGIKASAHVIGAPPAEH